MATKKDPTKTTPKKKAPQPKIITVVPTPATQKALKKVHKRMMKFVTDPSNDKEQVELYFAEINTFIKVYKEAESKSLKH